ncbi:hypothetical protein MCELHM10_03271 [Paracoccaceae bacterium]|jgi:hypothetical protein
MRHSWVFDILADLQAYASRNDLPRLAEKVALALLEARAEIAGEADADPPTPLTFRARRRIH